MFDSDFVKADYFNIIFFRTDGLSLRGSFFQDNKHYIIEIKKFNDEGYTVRFWELDPIYKTIKIDRKNENGCYLASDDQDRIFPQYFEQYKDLLIYHDVEHAIWSINKYLYEIH